MLIIESRKFQVFIVLIFQLFCVWNLSWWKVGETRQNKIGMNGGTSLVVHWLRILLAGFPGGSVVKNPPANAEDTGSIPGLGRSHMPQSSLAHAPQLLTLASRAWELQLLNPHATTTEAHAPQQEKPLNEKPSHCN